MKSATIITAAVQILVGGGVAFADGNGTAEAADHPTQSPGEKIALASPGATGAAAQAVPQAQVLNPAEAAAAASKGTPTAAAVPDPPPEPGKLALKVYGIFRPAVTVANGLQTFGRQNFVAPTAAANPGMNANTDEIGMSFQVMQTRFGAIIGHGYPARGRIEVDFVQAQYSSPTTAAFPRVRLAYVEYEPGEGHQVLIGQAWDLFSPLNTHTYDLVANLFQAGNSAFVRQQALYLGTAGNFEYGMAVGLAGTNNATELGNVEYGLTPTVSARIGVLGGKVWSLRLSGIGTKIRFGTPDARSHRTSAGAALSGEVTLGGFNLRAETYGGSNMANIGLLTLGQGRPDVNMNEFGGWVSSKYTVSTFHAIHAIVGMARILNGDDLLPAYGDAGNGPGIEQNLVARLGYTASPVKGLSFVVEPFLMATNHRLTDTDIVAGVEASRLGYGVQTGGMYKF